MRRGFNLIEVIIATAITALVLVAVMTALDASFKAYRATTESTSSGVSGRIVLERLQGLIRNGIDFAPYPGTLSATVIESDALEVQRPDGSWIMLAWDPEASALTWTEQGSTYTVLEGVTQLTDGDSMPHAPFVLEYQLGRHLHRATIDLHVIPDDEQPLDIEGSLQPVLRLVGSATPRNLVWNR